MATNWSQEKNCEGSTQVGREAERSPRVQTKSLVPRSLPTAGYVKWKMCFVGWDVMLAVLAGVMIFFTLNVASFGVLGAAVTVATIVAAVGLGHYLLWGRLFAQGVARDRQRFQDQGRRPETSQTEPPDEFFLELNDRERMELLQLLEHSLVAATEGRGESDDGTAIRRKLQDNIRMFGA